MKTSQLVDIIKDMYNISGGLDLTFDIIYILSKDKQDNFTLYWTFNEKFSETTCFIEVAMDNLLEKGMSGIYVIEKKEKEYSFNFIEQNNENN